MIAAATAALRDAAVAAMPADLGALLAAATDAAALVEACDVAACDPRCDAPWFDASEAVTCAACYDLREAGMLPTWWDGGYDDAADRHAATLPADEADEDRTCWRCTGCGEGATPESTCPVCRGRGVLDRRAA